MDELAAQVRQAGVDASSLRWWREDPEPIALLTIPGAKAVDAWTRLRGAAAATACYPLLLGGPDELEYLEEALEGSEETAPALIRAAQSSPADAEQWARARLLEQAEALRGFGEAAAADQRQAFAERLRSLASRAAPAPGPIRRRAEDFSIPLGAAGTRPLPTVELALLPTAAPWQAPLFLRFGSWNECPDSPTHAGLLRVWGERYGAEPVGITHDVLEARVLRPPQAPDDALALALAHFAYAPDSVEQGVGSVEALAEALLEGGSWRFWWE